MRFIAPFGVAVYVYHYLYQIISYATDSILTRTNMHSQHPHILTHTHTHIHTPHHTPGISNQVMYVAY